MTIDVREATPDDLPLVVRFNAAMALETEGKTLDCTVLEPGVRRALADPGKGRYFGMAGSGGSRASTWTKNTGGAASSPLFTGISRSWP
jgi:hypothetical protein